MVNNGAAFGVYKDRAEAHRAVDRLAIAGVSLGKISVLLADPEGSRDFAAENHTQEPETIPEAPAGHLVTETLGVLVGIGALVIPGGPYAGTGPMIEMIHEMGGGESVESLQHALSGLGLSEEVATNFQAKIKEGSALLSVQGENPGELSRLKDLLAQTGAEDIAATDT